jgi:hypothetical protein
MVEYLGHCFCLAALFTDLFRVVPQVMEAQALGAVASFGSSGVIILRSFRKRVPSK